MASVTHITIFASVWENAWQSLREEGFRFSSKFQGYSSSEMDQEAAGHTEATDRERESEREMGVGVQLPAVQNPRPWKDTICIQGGPSHLS